MNDKQNDSPINPEYIQKLIEDNDKLKIENQALKAKVGDLTIKNDILKDVWPDELLHSFPNPVRPGVRSFINRTIDMQRGRINVHSKLGELTGKISRPK